MIDLAQTTPDLWHEVNEAGDVRYCFTCATCIAGCPASEAASPLLIRSLARKVVLGLKDALLEDDTPWLCVTCSRCEEMCPMGVRPFELCLEIRQWQCHNDDTRIPPSVAEIYRTGYTQPVAKALELRRSVGLTEPPPAITRFPEMLDQFRALLMSIGMISDNAFMFRSES
jgi:heterodisulfide reductase subunit C